MTTKYPAEVRESVLREVLSNKLGIREASRKYSVHPSTIHSWVKQARDCIRAAGSTPSDAAAAKKDSRPPLPRGWTIKRAYAAVVLREHLGAQSEEFGTYCRAQGILAADVDKLAQWFATHELTDLESRLAAEASLRANERRIKELEGQITRKDKALAETAALLVLSKKAEAIWGTKEN